MFYIFIDNIIIEEFTKPLNYLKHDIFIKKTRLNLKNIKLNFINVLNDSAYKDIKQINKKHY